MGLGVQVGQRACEEKQNDAYFTPKPVPLLTSLQERPQQSPGPSPGPTIPDHSPFWCPASPKELPLQHTENVLYWGPLPRVGLSHQSHA